MVLYKYGVVEPLEDEATCIEFLKIEMFLKYRTVILDFYAGRPLEQEKIYGNWLYCSDFLRNLLLKLYSSSTELKKIVDKYIGSSFLHTRNDYLRILSNSEMTKEIVAYSNGLFEKLEECR